MARFDAGVRTVLDLRTPAEPPGLRSLLGETAAQQRLVRGWKSGQ